MSWEIQPQETEGTYKFSGKFLITHGVNETLSQKEIATIYHTIQQMVKDTNGIDYLVSIIHSETKQKLFFIDQLNQEMIDSGQYSTENNYCTLMLTSEY